MAVPCLADDGAAAISRASMITTWSYVSMTCVQRGAPSNPVRLPRVSSAVSTFRAAVSSAVLALFVNGFNAFQTCGRHPLCADAPVVVRVRLTGRRGVSMLREGCGQLFRAIRWGSFQPAAVRILDEADAHALVCGRRGSLLDVFPDETILFTSYRFDMITKPLACSLRGRLRRHDALRKTVLHGLAWVLDMCAFAVRNLAPARNGAILRKTD